MEKLVIFLNLRKFTPNYCIMSEEEWEIVQEIRNEMLFVKPRRDTLISS